MRIVALTLMVAWVPLAAYGFGAAGCSSSNSLPATSDDSGTSGQNGNGADSSTGQQGSPDSGSASNGEDASQSTGGLDASPPVTDAESSGNPTWVDMNYADGAADPHACDNHPGVPCGWAATNNKLGYTCACAFPKDQDPWSCSAPDSGAPATCSATIEDAGGGD
jgi:hypothetical protein